MLVGKELKGFHELIHCSILNSDVDVRKQLYENIVLSGGTTMFPNIQNRLTNELIKLAPSSIKVKVAALA